MASNKKINMQRCGSNGELLMNVRAAIKSYKKSRYEAVAIVCRNDEEEKAICKYLEKYTDVNVLSLDDEGRICGINLARVDIILKRISEFSLDAAIIFNASGENYAKTDEIKQLNSIIENVVNEVMILYIGEPVSLETDDDTKKAEPAPVIRQGDAREKYGPRRIAVEQSVKSDVDKRTIHTAPTAKLTGDRFCHRVAIGDTRKVASHLPWESGLRPGAGRLSARKSGSEFGNIPDTSALTPAGHGKIDNAVRWIEEDERRLSVISNYGTLQIVPLSDRSVRVIFFAGHDIGSVNELSGKAVRWNVRDKREVVSAELLNLKIEIVKKNGAIRFLKPDGNMLLSENESTARHYLEARNTWWNYFDFGKKERIIALGGMHEPHDISKTARYISHGLDSQVDTVIRSRNGYEIKIAAGSTILFSTNPAFGSYIKYENCRKIEYEFCNCT